MEPLTLDGDQVKALVTRALREDEAKNDCTVEYLDIDAAPVRAQLVARELGVLAGMECARLAFHELDPETVFDGCVTDGARVAPGDVIADVSGDAGPVLGAERVALNFLQRLSGIATQTAKFVAAVRGTDIRILDTRKTTPTLRDLEKYAVRVGGGENHRFHLGDMILIKENHIRACGGFANLIGRLGIPAPGMSVEVEVDSVEQLRELFVTRVDRIMLDNFSATDARAAVKALRTHRQEDPDFRPSLELSGGVTLTNIHDYLIPGVDFISVGALTHSSPALDISLEVTHDAG